MSTLPQHPVLPLFENRECTKCNRVLATSDFSRRGGGKDELSSICRSCMKAVRAEQTAAWVARRAAGEPIPTEKTCSVCETRKPLSEFCRDKSRVDGHMYECKACMSERKKAYDRLPHVRKQQAEKQRAYRASNPELAEKLRQYSRRYHRLRAYGVPFERFEEMKREQGNRCAICGVDFDSIARKKIHLDHCHETGKVRKVLCGDCNMLVGFCGENESVLLNAVAYLRAHQAE